MKRDKKWFVDKWTKERNKTDVHDPMYHFINEFIADVSQLDEPEVLSHKLPVLPKYVADWIKEEQGTMSNWKLPSRFISDSKYKKDQRRYRWSQVEGNMDKFMSALINSYEVEEEPMYYALIKGHELTAVEGDWTRKYWNFDTSNGYVFPSNLFTKYGRYLTEMSKAEWNELGINDSNADFVKVGE